MRPATIVRVRSRAHGARAPLVLLAASAATAPVQEGAPMGETRLRGELREREPMARHVSWRAGGVADQLYVPADLSDLQVFLRRHAAGVPIYFIGLGSNLLVRDGGLRGTVVLTHRALRQFRVDAARREITAEAGVACPKLARLAAVNGWSKAEFLAGIPGTLGGALAMNAGCYGAETWDIVTQVSTIDRAGNLCERNPADFEVGYRSVMLKAGGETRLGGEQWFVAATLRFAPGDSIAARLRIKELLARRIASQPLSQPNAGSVFRNPPGDYAARLIEACGLKGHAIGGALISPLHANFIVNAGAARAAHIEALIDLAQRCVREKFGIELEREVRIIGEA